MELLLTLMSRTLLVKWCDGALGCFQTFILINNYNLIGNKFN